MIMYQHENGQSYPVFYRGTVGYISVNGQTETVPLAPPRHSNTHVRPHQVNVAANLLNLFNAHADNSSDNSSDDEQHNNNNSFTY